MREWIDEFGGVYTANRKRLLKAPDVKRYRIAEGCEETGEHAFDNCKVLESLYVPESWKDVEAGDVLNCMPTTVDNFCHWDRPYVDEVFDVNDYWCDEDKTEKDEFGVVYANEGRRLIGAFGSVKIEKHYDVPDGVLTICDGAFMGIDDYLELSVPRSIKVIGDFIFGEESGKIVIRD